MPKVTEEEKQKLRTMTPEELADAGYRISGTNRIVDKGGITVCLIDSKKGFGGPVPGDDEGSARNQLKKIRKQIADLTSRGETPPRDLKRRYLMLMGITADDPKLEASLIEKSLKLEDETDQNSIADVPKEVLATIAGLEARGITPWHPAME